MSEPISQNGTLEEVLAGIDRRFHVSFTPMNYDGTMFEILDVENMTEYLDALAASGRVKNPLKELPIWAKVWPGSFVLETYLRRKAECAGRTLLELGCGVGVLSLLASRLGFAHITASDIEENALLFTRANVLKNGLEGLIDVLGVDVTRPGRDPRLEKPVDVIAASEILYLDELHGPLLNFLGRHLADGGQAVFCTDMARRKPHFAKKAAKKFRVQELYLPGSFTDSEGERHQRLYSLLMLQK
ncbi:MAG: 50S ribosomal protein L11 methyltransferase [Desulfovibrionaceae bacterium]|nr:50S ribosomal protein L11 methyltransferase [Desulfovibrionaceae bacterium]